MPKLNRVLETALYVADLERAAAFYGDVLGLPLGNDQAVERILMIKRQRRQNIQMARRNPKELYGIPIDMLRHQGRERERHCETTQTDFDGHFPEAGDTEQPFIGTVLDELACIGAEGRIAANKPEKGVRIE